MNQSNYFKVGPDVHCSYCHLTVAREDFFEGNHLDEHQKSNPQDCKPESVKECAEWANRSTTNTMTNNKEGCCKKCLWNSFSGPRCNQLNCICHTKAQEEWENKIIPEYSSIAMLDEYAVDGYYIEPAVLFITNLLRTEREKAVSEHDAKWHPLVKGTMVNMHGFKEGRQQAFAEVKVMVEEMKQPYIEGQDKYQKYARLNYNEALTDLLTKLEEKKEGI